MSRPTDPLLRWLRQQVDARGHTTASLADVLARPRAEVRRILTGDEPMLVDDLLAIGEALELDAAALGVPADLPDLPDEGEGPPEPASFGNHIEALVRLGFDLGIDFLFLADTDALGEDWGGPDDVFEAYAGRELPIRLDAAYHRHMDLAVTEEGVELTLSFDRLYRCRFPFASILRVVFMPDQPPAPEEPAEEVEEAPEPVKGPPHLRLVT